MSDYVNLFLKQLNLNVRGLGLSHTLAINEQSNRLKEEGKQIFKLGLGQSPFPVPPEVTAHLVANAHQKDYLPVSGLQQLKDAVANYHRCKDGVDCTGDDVMIAPGSKELMFLLQLVYYGDIVIPTPAWVSYAPQARIIGRHVNFIHTKRKNGYLLTAEELDDFCKQDPGKPRILILNYPSNPTGRTYKESELKDLAQVARKYDVILLSDEIYGELHHEGKHLSVARYYPEGSIISAGLSKWCGAGGWRLGTFLFPKNLRWLLEGMSVVASETYTSTSAPIQFAAVRAYEGGPTIQSYLQDSRAVLKMLGTYITAQLHEADIDALDPQGAFYLFLDFKRYKRAFKKRGITTSDQLTLSLLNEAGVATLPGSNFGRPPEELSLRLAYVDFDGTRALSAARDYREDDKILDGDFLSLHFSKIVQAIDALVQWCKKGNS